MSTDKTLAGSSASHDQPKYNETRRRRSQLFRAALSGDLNYKVHEDDITALISKAGDTALHIAATAESSDFAISLVDKMKKHDLAVKNKSDKTAFFIAAASGKLQLAEAMIRKNPELAMIPRSKDNNEMLPICVAALFGHKEMVIYLYSITQHKLNDTDGIKLFRSLIDGGLYDVALQLLEKHPDLAIAREATDGEKNWEKALKALAPLPTAKHQGFWKRINPCTNKKLSLHALELIKLVWELVLSSDDYESSDTVIETARKLIFVAAEQGNIEFLTTLIREYPDLILETETDDNRYSIFHMAVKYRQRDIFKLIYEIGSFKNFIAPVTDDEGNNILHLAGMLPPLDRLNTISGAALQMQQELLWFEEVKKIMNPLDAEAKNYKLSDAEAKEEDGNRTDSKAKTGYGKTPRDLFSEQHEDLKKKGEKWMKHTANCCMIVAALITTVVFAASFTVPGGINDDTGTPHFVHKVSFKIFFVSDTISLVLSTCSILTFLSILTSRYAEEDFLFWLPNKLLFGLVTLSLSIATLMMVFCATIFIVFKDGVLWLPILVTVIASLPVIFFNIQLFRLLYEVARSTYKSSFLFKRSKRPLFYPEGKTMELA